ncbi:dihydrofolate reductase [Scytonema sp. NUACC26]|uniref:dihydrofolate reductase n=1 Tax=Scytonema sp. NUACC26 TaxID=3140176 RepID=UPI0034DC45E4
MTYKINLIAAIGKNGEIGENGQLVWRNKEDLRHFRELTTGHTVIMGMKTFRDDLGGHTLPHRRNIVLTTRPHKEDLNYPGHENLWFIYAPVTALFLARTFNTEIFVIGGSSIYNIFLPFVNRLFITHVHQEFPDADRFLHIDWEQWIETNREDKQTFTWSTYERKMV